MKYYIGTRNIVPVINKNHIKLVRRTSWQGTANKIDVPSNAFKAEIKKLGGDTVVSDGTLVSATVNKIKAYKENTTLLAEINIPSEILSLQGYGQGVLDAFNEVDFENKKYIQRVESIDLGTLRWLKCDTNKFQAKLPANMKITDVGNRLIAKWTDKGLGYDEHLTEDKSFITDPRSRNIYVYDTSYSTVQAFVQAIQGEILLYELKTPIDTDISTIFEGFDVEEGGTLEFVGNNNVEVFFKVEFYI